MTIGEQFQLSNFRPSGFDYLRLTLACLVIVVHGANISYGTAYADQVWRLPILHAASYLILPMFFALSGFLIAGSAQRARSLVGFLGNRAMRIYPALTVEVLLSAFILGPIFTTMPLAAYFTDHEFLRYLVNVTGHISFHLPGVFVDNPNPLVVNRQLWTVPYELYCYAAISVLMVIGAVHRRLLFLISIIALQAMVFARAILTHGITEKWAGHLTGKQLVFSFLAGIAVYLYRDRLPYGRVAGALALIASFVLFSFPGGHYVGVFVAAYLTACLGVSNVRRIALIRGADYSYGLYLYGFVIQQALAATGSWARNWTVNVVAALILSAAFAAFSLHVIEKPAVRAKGPLRRLEDRWLVVRARLAVPFGGRLNGLPGRAVMQRDRP